MAEEKKIVVRRKGKKAKAYDANKHGMGNVLPEAEVVAFTGSERVQKFKKKLYNAQKAIGNARGSVEKVLKRREEKGK